MSRRLQVWYNACSLWHSASAVICIGRLNDETAAVDFKGYGSVDPVPGGYINIHLLLHAGNSRSKL